MKIYRFLNYYNKCSSVHYEIKMFTRIAPDACNLRGKLVWASFKWLFLYGYFAKNIFHSVYYVFCSGACACVQNVESTLAKRVKELAYFQHFKIIQGHQSILACPTTLISRIYLFLSLIVFEKIAVFRPVDFFSTNTKSK